MGVAGTCEGVLLFAIISYSITQGNIVCNSFGNNLKQSSSNAKNGLFLMTQSTAGCAGNATKWNACYYNSSTSQLSTVTFGVYHRYSQNNYTLIPGSAMTYSVLRNGSSYSCVQFPIPQNQWFKIQQGDIIAACTQAVGNGSLNIYGNAPLSNVLIQASTTCGSNLQSVITTTTQSRGVIMHVALDVNECAVSNGGCSQVCNDIPLGVNCSCFSGYELDANNTSCNDINECGLGTHSCSQWCNNTVGSYMCACKPGYFLTTDGITCLAEKTISEASSASYGAIVVLLVPIAGVIVFVLVFMQMRRRRKYTLERNDFENMTYNSAVGASKTSAQSGPAYEDLQLVEQHPTEVQKAESYEVPKGETDNYALPDEISFSNGKAESEVIIYCCPADQEDEIYMQLKAHGLKKIPPSEIRSLKELGRGKFGDVRRGVWSSSSGDIEVALKTLNPSTSSKDAKIKLLQEAAIMAQFKHPNVIQLHGIVAEGENLTLVIELALKGDLRGHLNSLKPRSPELSVATDVPRRLLRYSQQVALGMQYLSNKSFIHRDLAARNILVSKDEICKIADFGLSRDLSDANYYVSHGGMVPVKWTAPEAVLYKKYSSQSDVWSYGCLLYEIWSMGHKPFEDNSNSDVIAKIDEGYRLPPPPGCPLLVYEMMIQCWNPDAHSRPVFRDLHLSLAQYEQHVLKVPPEALGTHPQAGILGAPLEAGYKMYTDLQHRYAK